MQRPNPNTILRQHSAKAAALLSSLVAATGLSAQTAPAAPKEEVVELSVFTVSTEKDYGYRASNSIAGTRSNTPIRDVPVSIQVLTKDLADDLMITNQVDLERYNASRINGARDPRSEIPIQHGFNANLFRGFRQNWGLRDGVREYDPVDTQGLSRVEVVKGPVGALYGLSYPGGIVNSVSKDVDFNRNFAKLDATIFNEGGYRGAVDANYAGDAKVGKFGIRYNGVNMEDKDDRAHSTGAVRMDQILLAYQPTRDTTLKFMAERGLREKPNGLGYFTTGEVDSTGAALGNGTSIPLQEFFKDIPYTWNWSTGTNHRAAETKLYRGSVTHQVGESLFVTANAQFSDRKQIDGQGWDANGSGGADSWEAGGGWIAGADNLPGTSDDIIRMGYSYRDWSNSMHNYGATAVYKVDVLEVKNTFTFGANVWTEKFVSRASTANQFVDLPVKAGIAINVPWAPPASLTPNVAGAWQHEDNSNDYYFVSWQTASLGNRLKTNLALNRTNLKLVAWPNGLASTPGSVTEQSKTSPMAGVVFDVTKALSVFAVHGTSLFPTTDKNTFGVTMPPVVGKSAEFGLKFDLAEDVLSGTASFYQITQTGGQQFDPTANNVQTARWDSMTDAQRAVAFPGRVRSDIDGDIVPGTKQKSEGFEVDLVYQPIKAWQTMVSYAYNTNKTTSAIDPAQKGRSTPGSIKHQLSLLTKYEVVEGVGKGFFVGLGTNLSGKSLQGYDLPNGGARYYPKVTNVDLFLGYKTKLLGYNSRLQLNVRNLAGQEEYVGWKATGSSSKYATEPYRIDVPIRYNLTLSVEL